MLPQAAGAHIHDASVIATKEVLDGVPYLHVYLCRMDVGRLSRTPGPAADGATVQVPEAGTK